MVSALLVLVFVALHVAGHLGVLPLLRAYLPNRYSDRVADLQPYQRVKCAKLVRSSVYDAIAFACGVLLLWQCRALYDLCHKYTKFHEYVFSFALAHWVVSFFEDWMATARSFELRLPLADTDADTGKSDAELQPRIITEANATATPALIHFTCLVHHAVAAGAFYFILATQLLGGMGAVGLLYEGPALLMNIREALVDFDPAMGWLRPLGGQAALRCVHIALHLLFLPCRTGGDCLYLYASFGPGYAHGIGTLPAYARAACHTFAGFFLCINFSGWWLLCWQSIADTDCMQRKFLGIGIDALDNEDDHEGGRVDNVHELRLTQDATRILANQPDRPPDLVRLTRS